MWSFEWLTVLAAVLILFGAGRRPIATRELAQGMRAFRSGIQHQVASENAGERPDEAEPATGSPQ
jgi:Sec-independent protein translocase protein TatA